MNWTDTDIAMMRRTLELAARGQGAVEPNPMVGCVIVADGKIVGEGWHAKFGDLHAEAAALADAEEQACGATAYVTLEPCCHHGKTPPCSSALIEADVARVVFAMGDPFPQGGGSAALEAASIEVASGLFEAEARELNRPYLKLVETGRPWIIAKWAITLDGHLATHTGDSQWISCEESRAIVHEIRGRVDAVMVGRGTAEADDPLLTARPVDAQSAGPRIAARIVVDTNASLSLESQLVKTAADVPVIVAAGDTAPEEKVAALTSAGCEVIRCEGDDHAARLTSLLDQLGQRRMTNILVEGGAQLLGSLFDAGCVDEVHAFIAPKMIGGERAPTPIAGRGVELMSGAARLANPTITQIGVDAYVWGRVERAE